MRVVPYRGRVARGAHTRTRTAMRARRRAGRDAFQARRRRGRHGGGGGRRRGDSVLMHAVQEALYDAEGDEAADVDAG